MQGSLIRHAWVNALALLLACATPALHHPSTPVARAPTPAPASAHASTPEVRGPAATLIATGKRGAVSSAEANASEIGRAVLARGGNAVDAAVAVGFALGVTHPSAANIGGGGFMLVRTPDGRYAAFDYREVAPGAAHRDMFVAADGRVTSDARRGPLAAGIPGVVAGLASAHAKFGTLPWASLIEPAIALAQAGVDLDSWHAEELAEALEGVTTYADEVRRGAQARPQLLAALKATRASFGHADGTPYRAGERWSQPALAESLRRIASDGAEAFYRGPWARELATKVHALGGLWTERDLEHYAVIEREPIVFQYHGHEIATMPPPSAGGIVLRQILAAADTLQLHKLAWDSTRRIHLYVEILRRAYADRNELTGDPAFVQIPLQTLLSRAYLEPRMRAIDLEHATPSSQIRAGLPLAEGPHTTHFSIVDGSGMAVSNTYTLNTNFGALVQIPDTGVTLNNEMDDFTARPGSPNAFGLVQGAQNAIQPGKRMLSSMTPTIVSRAGKLRAVLGSPGGPTITTTVAQILMQLVDHDRSLQRAVEAPRIHHQWLPDHIWHEAGVDSVLREDLRRMGHKLELERIIGHAHCIEVDPESGELRAVADVARGGGGASAY